MTGKKKLIVVVGILAILGAAGLLVKSVMERTKPAPAITQEDEQAQQDKIKAMEKTTKELKDTKKGGGKEK
jgi:Tfp pilus assembly major pilin PilA